MTADTRTIVVTGGTSGIGKAIAIRFGKAGGRVVVSGRDPDKGNNVASDIEAVGGRALFVPTELSDPGSVESLLDATREAFGDPDVLVNSGGILQSGSTVLDQDLDEHDRLWEVNYRGTFLCCQSFGKAMKPHAKGVIINVASLASYAPLPLPAYAPGKAAILSLTEILAAELGPHGIRVNGVAPGFTLSDGLKEKIAKGERNPDAILKTTALRDFVLPEQVAEAVFFLCSDGAATITGITLPIDAGWLAQVPYAGYMTANPIRPKMNS